MAPERYEQLKTLAASLNLSLGETIGYLLNREIERGAIPDALPGVALKRVKVGVRIEVEGQSAQTFSRDIAHNIADALDLAADKGGGRIDVDDSGLWHVYRVGNGIRVYLGRDGVGEARTVTRDVARDFARLIREAVA